MKLFIDRFDADKLWYVFDEDAAGSEVAGPFNSESDAVSAMDVLNADSASEDDE